MKKSIILGLYAIASSFGENTVYTPGSGGSQFNLNDTNSLGSQYASQYGKATSAAISRVVRSVIFDAAPKQLADVRIMGMKTPKMVNSDEFFYSEMGFGRDAVRVGAINSDIATGSTQTIPVANMGSVALDYIVIMGDNWRGTITAINTANSTITVTAPTGLSLPAITAAPQGTYSLTLLSPVEGDAATGISVYYRTEPIERMNYVQAIVKAQRWGKMELEKYRRAGTFNNYLAMQKQRLAEQFRIDLSSVHWNGQQGEVTLANGQKAKTAGGVFPIMQQVGSPNDSVTLANSVDALIQLAIDTEYGNYGETRFVYGDSRIILALTRQLKDDLTRYAPNDSIAKLGLSSIDAGSSKLVFVPVRRFAEPSCFPSTWRNRLILLDNENIQPVYFLPEEMGDTLPRQNNGTLNNFTDSWMYATYSIEFYNPLACGWLDITDGG